MAQILNMDARRLADVVPAESVHLVVTSPPYNVGIDYDGYNDNMPWPEWRQMMADVFAACFTVLVPGGRICVNVANVYRKPYKSLTTVIWPVLENTGFYPRGEIIWDKCHGPASTAWGTFRDPHLPVLCDLHEYILVASKGEVCAELGATGYGDITKDEFLHWRKSVWRMKTASAVSVGHPAPFPEELPERLIRLYTYPGNTVLDPFAGSGTTLRVAERLGREAIGVELSAEYCRLIEKRLDRNQMQLIV